MKTTHPAMFLSACMLLALRPGVGAGSDAPPPSVHAQPERIVAVGAVMGEFGHFVQTLQDAGLLDDDAAWIGGGAHLVLLGNTIGPGHGLMPTIDLVRRLEHEAAQAGGMVHTLLGRTEFEVMHHDYSSIDPIVYQHLGADIPEDRLREFIDQGMQQIIEAFPDNPETGRRAADRYWNRIEQSLTPGALAFLDLFNPGEELGEWLRTRNVVVRLGEFLFSAGGVSLHYAGKGVEEINAEFRLRLAQEPRLFLWNLESQDAPAWWRGLLSGSDSQLEPLIDSVLHHQRARAQIIGMNNSKQAPTRYALRGRVFFVDSGSWTQRFQTDTPRRAALEIVGDTFTVMWDGHRLNAPTPGPIPASAPLGLP